MESGSFKGLEFVVIVGVVAWFYFTQMRKLKTLKEEREAKQQAEPATESKAEQRSTTESSAKRD
ncbi:MAG: hypothetical protein WBM40_07545 [Thiohalocapsa sp.]